MRAQSDLFNLSSLKEGEIDGGVVMASLRIRENFPFSSKTKAIPVIAMPGSMPRTNIAFAL